MCLSTRPPNPATTASNRTHRSFISSATISASSVSDIAVNPLTSANSDGDLATAGGRAVGAGELAAQRRQGRVDDLVGHDAAEAFLGRDGRFDVATVGHCTPPRRPTDRRSRSSGDRADGAPRSGRRRVR